MSSLSSATNSTTGQAALPAQVERDVCIVGAGPGGLSVARALKRAGVSFDLVERHSDVGGIWDIDNPGSPLYESAHFISSSGMSHFAGAPMPADYPDYPNHEQILDYIRSVARAEDLYANLSASTTVEKAVRQGDEWLVALKTPVGEETRRYGHLVCASGTTWHPKSPDWPGAFSGEIIHSSAHRKADAFKGKRVLVVGAGNSGCDIACDAAQTADAAFISVRRGYYFIPKHVFGEPADVFGARSSGLPLALRRPIFQRILKMYNGDVTKLGLPAPDHKVFESHPIMNDQLIHYLRHGDVLARGDVERLDGSDVVFKDGRREQIDVIVCATGYETRAPYLAEDAMPMKGGRPDLFMNIFSRENDRLYATGFLESNSGLFKLFDQMGYVIAQAITAQDDASRRARLRRIVETERPDLSGGVAYVGSDRHANYVNIDAYRKGLHRFARRMGWRKFDPDQLKLERRSSDAPSRNHRRLVSRRTA